MKFVAGERTFSIAPLGYMRHPNEHNKLAVDPDTSWIIEKIFDLAAHGAGSDCESKKKYKVRHHANFRRTA